MKTGEQFGAWSAFANQTGAFFEVELGKCIMIWYNFFCYNIIRLTSFIKGALEGFYVQGFCMWLRALCTLGVQELKLVWGKDNRI